MIGSSARSTYNPRYGTIFEQLAHFEVMRRRYSQATVLLRRAIEVQPDLWSAQAELGSNLLREGDFAASAHASDDRVFRRSLQRDDGEHAAPARSCR